MSISSLVAHTKSFTIISWLELFPGFNLCFCSNEIVGNNLELEKKILGVDVPCTV
jgi:hypothetical protein